MIFRSRATRPAPRHEVTRFGDDSTGATALRTRRGDRQESALHANLALAAALRAGGWRRTRRRSGARAGFAGLLTRDLDGRLGPSRRLLERDLEIVAEVAAALRTAAAASAAEQIAEPEHVAQPAKQILETLEDGRVEASASPRS